jgi:hypothetical protein
MLTALLLACAAPANDTADDTGGCSGLCFFLAW